MGEGRERRPGVWARRRDAVSRRRDGTARSGRDGAGGTGDQDVPRQQTDRQEAGRQETSEQEAVAQDVRGRKPPKASAASWVERQIRDAQSSGAFDNLRGAGKPLPGQGRPRSDLDWVARRVRREDLDVLALLPPSLALPKELEMLPARVLRERSEHRVREIVLDLNERIRRAHRLPQVGPPLRAMPVDVEQVVEGWRASRPTP